jgi:hypothetical protein
MFGLFSFDGLFLCPFGMVQTHFSAFFNNDKIVPQTFFKNAASESGVFELCPPLVRGAPLQCVVLASGPCHSSQWFTQLKEGMDGYLKGSGLTGCILT